MKKGYKPQSEEFIDSRVAEQELSNAVFFTRKSLRDNFLGDFQRLVKYRILYYTIKTKYRVFERVNKSLFVSSHR